MMRLLILLALCVAASQARSTQSGSRMKLLSRVLDFLEERDDDPEPECTCPTGEQVVNFLVNLGPGQSIEEPDGICEPDTCPGLEEEIEEELVEYLAESGCECPEPPAERPEPGAGRPDRPENACPRAICFVINGGPPGGRSGPRGGGGRGPPSGEDSADDDKRHARRDDSESESVSCECFPPDEPVPEGAPPPCPQDLCGPPEDKRRASSLKTRAAKKHARRDDASSESCECRPPPPPGAGPPPEGAPPPCPPEDCSESESSEEERRASSLKTRALVNLLKSLLHKK